MFRSAVSGNARAATRDLLAQLAAYERAIDDRTAQRIVRKAQNGLERLLRPPRYHGLAASLLAVGTAFSTFLGSHDLPEPVQPAPSAYVMDDDTSFELPPPEPIRERVVEEWISPEVNIPEIIPVLELEPKPEVVPAPSIESFAQASDAPIFMYHHIGWTPDRYTVSPDRLRTHLNYLRENEYELVTFSEYARGAYETERPAVLTFDDSTVDQFRILADGSTDPDCAVGVLEEYQRGYPDWDVTGTFFVNTTTQDSLTVFEQTGYERYKLHYLVDHGYEIGAHGAHHWDYRTLSPEQITADLSLFGTLMDVYLPEYEVTAFAYPYGSIPSKEKQAIIESFYPVTAHAWGGVAQDETVNVPRIEVGPTTDLARYAPETFINPS